MSPAPAPRPTSPPPAPRPPAGPAPNPRPAGPKLPPLRLAVAMVAVGLIGLTVHYWASVLLLAALPTKQWRKAATS